MAWVRQLKCFVYLILISLLSTSLAISTALKMSLPGCSDKCGNITIPYPFGTRIGCYRNDAFQITCNNSTNSPKAFIGSGRTSNIELKDINILSGEARAYNKFIGYMCYDQSNNAYEGSTPAWIKIKSHPAFLFSNKRNKFTVIGCYTLAFIAGEGEKTGGYRSGCASFCESLNMTTPGDGGSCNGFGCCQTAIPAGLNYIKVQWGFNQNEAWDFNPCNYAIVVEEDWYKFQVQDLSKRDFYERSQNGVPFVLDWAIRDANGICRDGVENNSNRACLSSHSFCYNTNNGEGYLCNCSNGYQGNPYLTDGCLGNKL